MKTPLSPSFSGMFVVSVLAVCVSGLNASAQTSPGLSVQTCAGLTITGQVGSVYSVEYVTDLAQTNTPSAWQSLEFIQLPANPYLWADKSSPVIGKRFYQARVFPAPVNMVFIPPGTFRMGSPSNELDRFNSEGPQTHVIISRGFWMGKYEVTQGEYLAVMGKNPSQFTGDNKLPVDTVSWLDASNYCSQLTQAQQSSSLIPPNCVYRLPTESEWEYACRGCTSDRRFSYGDDPAYTNLTEYAWYAENSGNTTHPVGEKLPNPWGLYDMYGNVFEWCQNWYQAALPGGIVVDPQGIRTGWFRTIRGGYWGARANYLRSAARGFGAPAGGVDSRNGFRVVLAPSRP